VCSAATEVAVKCFAVQVDADGPDKGYKGEGGEQGADEGGFFRVAACIADGILQEIDARGKKYDEKEKSQIFFSSQVLSHCAPPEDLRGRRSRIDGSYITT
jgi:hypothetical protein